MPASPCLRGRLFRHDGLIAGNALRATFAAWRDRAMACVLILGALAALRAQVVDRPWPAAGWAALAVGVILGAGAERLIRARLHFHATDGLLAADGLHPSTRHPYVAAWHGIGVAMLVAVTLIVRPSLLVAVLPGYFIGALAALATARIAVPARAASRVQVARMIGRWLHWPGAGVAAALLLVAATVPARALSHGVLLSILGAGTLLLAAALTRVDDAAVRFSSVAGHGPGRVVVRHARGVLAFASVAAPACWLSIGPAAAAIVAVGSLALLLLMTLRILAYRLLARRSADAIVAVIAGMLLLVGVAMPLLTPLLALAIVWRLWRRAAQRTWLLS